jgi:DNA-binding NarL/FixJ family response regulator
MIDHRMRILIADDNDLVRRGVIRMLSAETDWGICGEARDGSEALRKARELLPDLILLDISMAGVSGLQVAHLLRHELPATKILMITQHDAIQLLPRAVEAGAHGCVDKGRLATDLLGAIRSILAAPDISIPPEVRSVTPD